MLFRERKNLRQERKTIDQKHRYKVGIVSNQDCQSTYIHIHTPTTTTTHTHTNTHTHIYKHIYI